MMILGGEKNKLNIELTFEDRFPDGSLSSLNLNVPIQAKVECFVLIRQNFPLLKYSRNRKD